MAPAAASSATWRTTIDIVDASRPAKPDEQKRAKEQGIDWTRFVVGYDGITLVVNAKNDFVKELTVEQLKAIWAPDSKVKTWKDVEPRLARSRDHALLARQRFGDVRVLHRGDRGQGEEPARDDVKQNASDNSLVKGVAGDADGLGYFGYAYYASNKDKLRAVAVRNGQDAPARAAQPRDDQRQELRAAVAAAFIYVKNSAARRPEVAQFVRFYLENVDKFAVEGGYDAPLPEDKAANAEALSRLLGEAKAPAAAKSPASKA